MVNNSYALYLRKSSADLDAEARGEGETLAKHRAALTAYARQRGPSVAQDADISVRDMRHDVITSRGRSRPPY